MVMNNMLCDPCLKCGSVHVSRSKRVLKKTGQCFVLNGIAFLGRCWSSETKSFYY